MAVLGWLGLLVHQDSWCYVWAQLLYISPSWLWDLSGGLFFTLWERGWQWWIPFPTRASRYKRVYSTHISMMGCCDLLHGCSWCPCINQFLITKHQQVSLRNNHAQGTVHSSEESETPGCDPALWDLVSLDAAVVLVVSVFHLDFAFYFILFYFILF